MMKGRGCALLKGKLLLQGICLLGSHQIHVNIIPSDLVSYQHLHERLLLFGLLSE